MRTTFETSRLQTHVPTLINLWIIYLCKFYMYQNVPRKGIISFKPIMQYCTITVLITGIQVKGSLSIYPNYDVQICFLSFPLMTTRQQFKINCLKFLFDNIQIPCIVSFEISYKKYIRSYKKIQGMIFQLITSNKDSIISTLVFCFLTKSFVYI